MSRDSKSLTISTHLTARPGFYGPVAYIAYRVNNIDFSFVPDGEIREFPLLRHCRSTRESDDHVRVSDTKTRQIAKTTFNSTPQRT